MSEAVDNYHKGFGFLQRTSKYPEREIFNPDRPNVVWRSNLLISG